MDPDSLQTNVPDIPQPIPGSEKPWANESQDSIGCFRKPPVDKNNLVWFICCLLGVGILFPWNVFITAIDYFTDKYPDVAFEFIVSLSYQWSSIGFFILSLRYGREYSLKKKIVLGFSVSFIMLVFVPIVGEIGLPDDLSLVLTLVAAGLTGIASALLFGTVLSFVAMLPPDYTTAVMSGNGVGAVFVAVMRIITKAIFTGSDGETESTILYFSIAAAIIFACIISYLSMLKMDFVVYHVNQNNSLKNIADPQEVRNIDEKTSLLIGAEPVGVDNSSQSSITHQIIQKTSQDEQQEEEEDINMKREIDGWEVFKMISTDCFHVWFIFFITLSLFPGMTGEIESQYGSLGDWFGIIMITLFQVGDMIGRTLPKWYIGIPHEKMAGFVWIRLVFYPLFILCINPHIFTYDPIPYCIMLVFSFTNGYFSTLTMIYAPSRVDARYRENAGLYMSFFLQFGIFCGVTFALLLLYLVEGSDEMPWN